MPNYQRIGALRSLLRSVVHFIALTATATREIKAAIWNSLLMAAPSVVFMLMERQGIYYKVDKDKPGDYGFLICICHK